MLMLHVLVFIKQPLVLDIIICIRQNGSGVVINNPGSQWLSYVSPSQVALHILITGIQADGAAIFSNIIQVGGGEPPEDLRAIIIFCDSET